MCIRHPLVAERHGNEQAVVEKADERNNDLCCVGKDDVASQGYDLRHETSLGDL